MSKITISINTSGADLLRVAKGKSTQRDAAQAEIARRVNKRHLLNKPVSASMQAIANAWEDRQDAISAEQIRAQVITRRNVIAKQSLVAELFDKGQVMWDADTLVQA
jgi:hypothetical protein